MNNSSFVVIILFIAALRSQFTFFSLTNKRFFFIKFFYFLQINFRIFLLFLKHSG